MLCLALSLRRIIYWTTVYLDYPLSLSAQAGFPCSAICLPALYAQGLPSTPVHLEISAGWLYLSEDQEQILAPCVLLGLVT